MGHQLHQYRNDLLLCLLHFADCLFRQVSTSDQAHLEVQLVALLYLRLLVSFLPLQLRLLLEFLLPQVVEGLSLPSPWRPFRLPPFALCLFTPIL